MMRCDGNRTIIYHNVVAAAKHRATVDLGADQQRCRFALDNEASCVKDGRHGSVYVVDVDHRRLGLRRRMERRV